MAAVEYILLKKVFFNQKVVKTNGENLRTAFVSKDSLTVDLDVAAWSKDLGIVGPGL